jgi:predicted small lipoprotein YifL
MKTTLRLLLLAFLLALAACGNKGELVLPDKPSSSA